MAKVSGSNYRISVARRLRDLANILSQKGVCIDPSPLESACHQCKTNKPNGEASWGYKIDNQLFRIQTADLHVYPPRICGLTLELFVEIEGRCLPSDSLEDPITKLEIGFNFKGKDDNKTFHSGWHFDRHIPNSGDPNPILVHPDYHFHFGGRYMESNYSAAGNVVLFDSPRIAHPPMDGVLAIDFILANFLGGRREELLDESTYRKLVKESQEVYWKPYAKVLASKWVNIDNIGTWSPTQIWPQLI